MIFTPAARAELIKAQRWYEKEVSGLGYRFLDSIDALVERISANPRHFPVVYKNVRRAMLRGFPYALIFVIEADSTLSVIACFSWQSRPGALAEANVS